MRDIYVYLSNIIEQAEVIQKITKMVKYTEFIGEPIYINAMSRSFEIIGEASKHIPDDFRLLHPEIEWKGMARFRDKLIHSYFSIDTVYMWEIAIETIPTLIKQIEAIINEGK